jgi:hypothetical protein
MQEQDRINQDDIEEVVAPRVSGQVVTLDRYVGEIVTHWWPFDKSHPEEKIRLDIRIRALKSGDLNIINRKFNEIVSMPAAVDRQQQMLARCKPSREIGRLQEKLTKIKDSDFEDDDPQKANGLSAEDKAEAARVDLEQRIQKLDDEWAAQYSQIKEELDRLLTGPSAYELLRQEYFSKVIDDHNIELHGRKIDFNHPAPEGEEPPDVFVTELRTFLTEAINRGKALRKNGTSVR